MSAHTPGPWYAQPYARQEPPDIIAANGAYVARAHAFDADHLAPETLANARLIAAAPDLLATLEKLRDSLRGRIDVTGDSVWHEVAWINAALAKVAS